MASPGLLAPLGEFPRPEAAGGARSPQPLGGGGGAPVFPGATGGATGGGTPVKGATAAAVRVTSESCDPSLLPAA